VGAEHQARRSSVRPALNDFVCAWCSESAAPASGDEDVPVTDNFGICSACLEERLQLLASKPARPGVRKRSSPGKRLSSRSA